MLPRLFASSLGIILLFGAFDAVGAVKQTVADSIELTQSKAKKKKKRKKRKSRPDGGRKRHFFDPSIGFSAIRHTETAGTQETNVNMTGITLKLAYRWEFIENWDVAGNLFFTQLPLTSSSCKKAAFLGANVRAGYRFRLNRRLSLSVMAGWYYSTMLVQDDTYGYNNMNGPQLFPVVNWKFMKRQFAYGYLKFSPMLDGLSILPIASNREIAGGVGWGYVLKNGHPIVVSLDVANFTLGLPSSYVSSTTSGSLSFGYGF